MAAVTFGRGLTMVPVGCAVATMAVMITATGGLDADSGTGGRLYQVLIIAVFIAWNLLPPVALVLLILVARRRLASGMIATVVGAVIYAVVTVWFLVDFVRSESSTSALLFVTLPVILLVLVLVAGLVTALVHRLRQRPSA